jgi:biotin carboxyl carrier protein
MRNFQVTVNGQTYEVSVEEVTGQNTQVAAKPAMPQAAPKAKAPAPKPASNASAGSVQVKAPMPGTILEIKVKPGDKVKNGQAVCVLEAMKMENEIPAPQDGTIASIEVTKGASVETGTVLVTMA